MEIDWAPLIASTSAGPKGRRPPAGPPSHTATRSPSAARRSWPAADDGLRPGHPSRLGLVLGPPAPPPETEPASATARAAVIPTAPRHLDSTILPDATARITRLTLAPGWRTVASHEPRTVRPRPPRSPIPQRVFLISTRPPVASTLSQSSVQGKPLSCTGWYCELTQTSDVRRTIAELMMQACDHMARRLARRGATSRAVRGSIELRMRFLTRPHAAFDIGLKSYRVGLARSAASLHRASTEAC